MPAPETVETGASAVETDDLVARVTESVLTVLRESGAGVLGSAPGPAQGIAPMTEAGALSSAPGLVQRYTGWWGGQAGIWEKGPDQEWRLVQAIPSGVAEDPWSPREEKRGTRSPGLGL